MPNHRQHGDCPPGVDSWCRYQVAKANNKLREFKHKPALHPDVVKAITSIYTDLSNDSLLERCVGGFTQNQNESLNNLIWCFAPKRVFSGIITVKIAANIATCIFNKGYSSILSIMAAINIITGPTAVTTCKMLDEERLEIADKRTFDSSKEGRIARRSSRSALEEAALEAEGPMYEAGMAD